MEPIKLPVSYDKNYFCIRDKNHYAIACLQDSKLSNREAYGKYFAGAINSYAAHIELLERLRDFVNDMADFADDAKPNGRRAAILLGDVQDALDKETSHE